jgi:hypothetical protein
MNQHELIVDRNRILQRIHTAIDDTHVTIRASHELMARTQEIVRHARCALIAAAELVQARDKTTRECRFV